MPRRTHSLLLVFAFLGLAMPLPAASRLIFPRIYLQSGYFAGLAITNPGSAAAEVTFRLYRQDGSLVTGTGIVNPATISLGAGHQFSRVAPEVFNLPDSLSNPAEALRCWMEVTSPSDGLTGFFLEGNTALTGMDGLNLDGIGTNIILPLVENRGTSVTSISLVNPNAEAGEVGLEFLRSNGSIAFSTTASIPSMGALQGALSSLFPGSYEDVAAMRLGSSQPVVLYGFIQRGNGDPIVLAAQNAAFTSKQLSFPFLLQGEGWSSTLGLVNLTSEAVLVTVSAMRSDGTLMSAPLLSLNPASRTIPAYGILRQDLKPLFGTADTPRLDGWVKVEANTSSVIGYIEYGTSSARDIAPAQLEPLSRSLFSHQATVNPYTTSISMLNPGRITANLEIVSISTDNQIIGKAQRVLKPGQGESLALQTLIPAAGSQVGGCVFVKSDVPILANEIFGTTTNSAIANIPPQKVPNTFDPAGNLPRLTLVPPLAVVETGKTQKFTAAGSPSFAWSVNGIAGGSSAIGTLTTAGLYTAPRTAPTSRALAVQASSATGDQSAGATLDVVQRETLTAGLTLVAAVAYFENLQRYFIAEQQVLASAPSDAPSEAPLAIARILEQTPEGAIIPTAQFYDTLGKMIPFVDSTNKSYLLIAGVDSGKIYRLEMLTQQLTIVATGLKAPNSLALDSGSGDLIVSEGGANAITVIPRAQFDPSAAPSIQSAPDSDRAAATASRPSITVTSPVSVAFDSCTGAVFVVTQDGRLLEYLGNTQRVVASGLDRPRQALVLHRQGVSPCAAGVTVLVSEATRVTQIFRQTGTAIPFLNDTPNTLDLAFFPQGNPFVPRGEAAIGIAAPSSIPGSGSVLIVPVGTLYGIVSPQPVNPVPAGGTALPFQDPRGDTFETKASVSAGLGIPDLLSVSAHGAGDSVVLTLTFSRQVEPASAGRPNSLTGFIDFDFKPNTGMVSHTAPYDLFGQDPTLGIDAYVDLASGSLVIVGGSAGAGFDSEERQATTQADLFFLGDALAVRIPKKLADVSRAKLAIVVGNSAEVTDVGPNQRFLGIKADTGTARTIQFIRASSKVAESAGSASVPVTLSSASSATVTVNYAVTGGTAVNGKDYSLASGTLTFNPGETAKSINIAIIINSIRQPDRTIEIAISNPSNAGLGQVTSHTVTILDDDPIPAVNFAQPAASVKEANTQVAVGLTLTNPSSSPVTVTVAVRGGSARLGTDYTLASADVIFAPGETNKSLLVNVLDDQASGPDRTLDLGFSSILNAIEGTLSQFKLTILESTAQSRIFFRQPSSAFPETSGAVNIQVNLFPAASGVVTVAYAITGGTAFTSDYTFTPGTLTFNPGDATKQIPITLNADMHDGPDRTVVITLSSPTGGAALGTPNVHTLTIQDTDQPPEVFFSLASSQGSEKVTPARINVALSTWSYFTVKVDYAATGGTATGGGADYTLAPGTITFTPGQYFSEMQIAIVDRGGTGVDKTIIVALSNPVYATIGAAFPQHTYTILSPLVPPTMQFVAPDSYSLNETIVVPVTIVLSAPAPPGGVSADISVDAASTATPNADYDPASIPLTTGVQIPQGEVSTILNIQILFNEARYMPPPVTLILKISNPARAVLGSPTTHTITIDYRFGGLPRY